MRASGIFYIEKRQPDHSFLIDIFLQVVERQKRVELNGDVMVQRGMFRRYIFLDHTLVPKIYIYYQNFI